MNDMTPNEAQASSHELVRQVLANAERVNHASRERSTFIERLAEQSRSIENDIKVLRENSEKTVSTLEGAAATATNISGEVQSIVGTLETAHKDIQILTEQLTKFEKRIKEVETVSSTIIDVAEQTSVLALNALIESARAGEHGRGFKVVANDVKALSTRTGQAAVQISQTVASLVTEAGAMSQDCNQLEVQVRDSARCGRDNLSVLQSLQASVVASATESRQTGAAATENITQLTGLIGDMNKLRDDTLQAIDGSARNIEIARQLERCIEILGQAMVADALPSLAESDQPPVAVTA